MYRQPDRARARSCRPPRDTASARTPPPGRRRRRCCSSSAYDGGPVVAYAPRPYPSGGGSYELELYLAVDACEGLARGFYHYDAGGHALVPISVRAHEFDALLRGAQFAMDAPTAPQILITIAARFGRVSWKYSSIAYALVL